MIHERSKKQDKQEISRNWSLRNEEKKKVKTKAKSKAKSGALEWFKKGMGQSSRGNFPPGHR